MLLFIGLTPAILASLPGEALYPFKQIIESTELTAAGSAEAQVFTHLLHAERRAQEALNLAKRGEILTDLFAASLAEMTLAADAARSEASISPTALRQLEARTAQITATLDSILHPSDQSMFFPELTLAPLMTSVREAQSSGNLLLPANTPTPTSTPTLTETTTPSAGLEQTPSASSTALSGEDIPWDENTDCDNPPPTWVPAEGWRARCEGAPRPQDESTEEGKRPAGDRPPPHAGSAG